VVSVDGVVVAVVVVVVVVVVDEVLPLSLPPQATVSVPAAIAAAIPATTEKRRGIRVSVMVSLDSCEVGNSFVRCTHSDPTSSAITAMGSFACGALKFEK
jgi:hypothetical protein